jgi:hypothetical protein
VEAVVGAGSRAVRVKDGPDAEREEPTEVVVWMSSSANLRHRLARVGGSHRCRDVAMIAPAWPRGIAVLKIRWRARERRLSATQRRELYLIR